MSGGVDSSVTAALLCESGYDVTGVTFRLWDPDEIPGFTTESHLLSVRDAGNVCEQLGIPHFVLDLREEFKREVMDLFEREYLAGRTPNPCVYCNPGIKWKSLWQEAQKRNILNIATGHYAKVILDPSGNPHLKRGEYRPKDQSYFLWKIPIGLLSHTLLPLGNYEKKAVREIAVRYNLPIAQKQESQEICFIPDNDYRKWLLRRRPDLDKGEMAGDVVDTAGKLLGQHQGYPFFTIGQRKGLGLGGGRKYYVTKIDAGSRRIHLGDVEDLETSEFEVGFINILQELPFDGSTTFYVKIRYRDAGVKAIVKLLPEKIFSIRTKQPVRAVTPGQAAVIYLDDEVIAGGIILPSA